MNKKTCPECSRPIADEDDEVVHNTGECGCEKARSLCWRVWNRNRCCRFSPYDHEHGYV